MSGRRGCDCRSEQDPTLCQGGMLLDLAECKIILRVNDRQLAPKWFSLHFFFFFILVSFYLEMSWKKLVVKQKLTVGQGQSTYTMSLSVS